MAKYTFRCPKCENEVTYKLTFAEYDKVKKGESSHSCPECTNNMSLVFAPGQLAMVMKEGPSGGWTAKAEKERSYRTARYAEMGRRQKDNVHAPTLQPNYEGVETGTWRDAQEEARKNKGDAAAAGYKTLVELEKK